MNIKVKITRDGSNRIEVMNIEEYLRGVVSREMSDRFPLEALKAQAVAARTYALYRIREGNVYDVDDTSRYQAYVKPTRVQTNIDLAIQLTVGQVMVYNGKIIDTMFCASNGGRMISAYEYSKSHAPCLVGKPDPWTVNSGVPKSGHGVGMSQRGAQWAGAHGKNYKDILLFYYEGATIASRYNQKVTYVVKKGDSLSKIAKMYMIKWTDLAAANKIKFPWIIKAGQVLTIPV